MPLNDSPATEQAIRDGAGEGSRVGGHVEGERERSGKQSIHRDTERQRHAERGRWEKK